MQLVYATVELRLPPAPMQISGQGQLRAPAHFVNDAQNGWTLLVWFDKPVNPGETIIVPITPLVPEAARLLVPEAEFELFIGFGGKAQGRVISIAEVSKDEMRRIFHLAEHYDENRVHLSGAGVAGGRDGAEHLRSFGSGPDDL